LQVFDSLPELRLRCPAIGLAQVVVPRGYIFLVVAAEAGEIDVKPVRLRKFQELAQFRQRLLIRLVGRGHELAELDMNANDVGAERLHLGEVALDRVPIGVPIILDQSPFGIVIVIEAPGGELLAGFLEHETLCIFGDANAFQRRRLRECVLLADEQQHQNQLLEHLCPIFLVNVHGLSFLIQLFFHSRAASPARGHSHSCIEQVS
jgi:hypothetical protein